MGDYQFRHSLGTGLCLNQLTKLSQDRSLNFLRIQIRRTHAKQISNLCFLNLPNLSVSFLQLTLFLQIGFLHEYVGCQTQELEERLTQLDQTKGD